MIRNTKLILKSRKSSFINESSARHSTRALEESKKISQIPMNHRTTHLGHENGQKNEQGICSKFDISGP